MRFLLTVILSMSFCSLGFQDSCLAYFQQVGNRPVVKPELSLPIFMRVESISEVPQGGIRLGGVLMFGEDVLVPIVVVEKLSNKPGKGKIKVIETSVTLTRELSVPCRIYKHMFDSEKCKAKFGSDDISVGSFVLMTADKEFLNKEVLELFRKGTPLFDTVFRKAEVTYPNGNREVRRGPFKDETEITAEQKIKSVVDKALEFRERDNKLSEGNLLEAIPWVVSQVEVTIKDERLYVSGIKHRSSMVAVPTKVLVPPTTAVVSASGERRIIRPPWRFEWRRSTRLEEVAEVFEMIEVEAHSPLGVKLSLEQVVQSLGGSNFALMIQGFQQMPKALAETLEDSTVVFSAVEVAIDDFSELRLYERPVPLKK